MAATSVGHPKTFSGAPDRPNNGGGGGGDDNPPVQGARTSFRGFGVVPVLKDAPLSSRLFRDRFVGKFKQVVRTKLADGSLDIRTADLPEKFRQLLADTTGQTVPPSATTTTLPQSLKADPGSIKNTRADLGAVTSNLSALKP